MDNKIVPGPESEEPLVLQNGDSKNNADASLATITVGPLIGKVTHTTARVLIEISSSASVTATLTPKEGDVVTRTVDFVKDRPRCFEFDELVPETVYALSVNVTNEEQRRGRVRTMAENPKGLRIVCAACDKPKNRGSINLFQKLYEDYIHHDHLDVFVRHGDQVYADHAFDAGKPVLKDTSLSPEQKQAAITELYAAVYRTTYNFPFTRLCMANCQTLCMWDDHELRNDWGTFPEDNVPTSTAYQLALGAREAYWLYQRQLWEDVDGFIDGTAPATHDYALHKWGQIGLLMVDNRGGRSFYSDSNPQSPHYRTENIPSDQEFLGSFQHAALHDALSPNGYYDDVTSLLIVQTIPLVHLPSCTSACFGCCCKPQQDKMGWGLHRTEQANWINAIDAWARRTVSDAKNNNVKTRDVLLVGGDMHFASESLIRNQEGRVVLRQVISSAISNKPPPNIVYYFVNRLFAAPCCCCNIAGFSVSNSNYQPQQNFTVCQVGQANDKPDVSYEVITGPKHCCNKRCC